jgi:hypothetical protein
VRVTTAFCRLLRLAGVRVRDVSFTESMVVLTVGLRRHRLVCGQGSPRSSPGPMLVGGDSRAGGYRAAGVAAAALPLPRRHLRPRGRMRA